MAVKKKLTGVDVVLRNLNKEIKGIVNRSKSGLAAAALVVKAASLKQTPIDTSHLRGSAFTEVIDGDTGPGAIIGYSAAYAPFVHEIDKNYVVGNFQFLRNALMENQDRVFKIIERSARIK